VELARGRVMMNTCPRNEEEEEERVNGLLSRTLTVTVIPCAVFLLCFL
jgi:hypothetical protein